MDQDIYKSIIDLPARPYNSWLNPRLQEFINQLSDDDSIKEGPVDFGLSYSGGGEELNRFKPTAKMGDIASEDYSGEGLEALLNFNYRFGLGQ